MLLCFLQQKADTISVDAAVKICADFSSSNKVAAKELANIMYDSGSISDDLCKSIFTALPKKSGTIESASNCFRISVDK